MFGGVPVIVDSRLPGIAESRGLWRWAKIVVGNRLNEFEPRERRALLLHELGHVRRRHLERRILALWLLLVAPRRLAALCREQEFEADRFVRASGYGPDLARAFRRFKPSKGPLHPPLAERIARLI